MWLNIKLFVVIYLEKNLEFRCKSPKLREKKKINIYKIPKSGFTCSESKMKLSGRTLPGKIPGISW
jgi:hypothetical protein